MLEMRVLLKENGKYKAGNLSSNMLAFRKLNQRKKQMEELFFQTQLDEEY